MDKLIILFILAQFILGCASKAIQTEALYQTVHNLPDYSIVQNVPFIKQNVGQCGPATLAMALNWAGNPISITNVVEQVYNPKMQGSLQNDLISASRRNGAIAIPISGLQNLLNELAYGNPVIVFENLAFSWLPQWHYAIAIGYDLPNKNIIMHSGSEAYKKWDLEKFERSWMLGDYWGLVVLPPGRLSFTADELDHVKAVLALEQAGYVEKAELAFESILSRWPQSLLALIGLSNLAFNQKNYSKSIFVLEKANKLYPESAFVWHNLAVAQGHANMKTRARYSAVMALNYSSDENKEFMRNNLKEWLGYE